MTLSSSSIFFLLLLALICFVKSSYQNNQVFKLHLKHFELVEHKKANGRSCRGRMLRDETCRTLLRICLQSNETEADCHSIGSFSDDVIIFGDKLPLLISDGYYDDGTISNPISFILNEFKRNEYLLSITIDVFPKGKDSMISQFSYRITAGMFSGSKEVDLAPSEQNGVPNILTCSAKLVCNTGFYGDDCSVSCIGHDDNENGHYTCSPNGEKICILGWKNVENNCLDEASTDQLQFQILFNLESFTWNKNTTLKDGEKCVNIQFQVAECNPTIAISLLTKDLYESEQVYAVGPLGISHSFTFEDTLPAPNSQQTIFNPIKFLVPDIKKYLYAQISVYHDGDKDKMIVQKKYKLEELGNFNFIHNDNFTSNILKMQDDTIEFKFKFRQGCLESFYGELCDTHCEDHNDYLGHYFCNDYGEKVCLKGWTNPASDCLEKEELPTLGPTPDFYPTQKPGINIWKTEIEMRLISLSWRMRIRLDNGESCPGGTCYPTVNIAVLDKNGAAFSSIYDLGSFGPNSYVEFGDEIVSSYHVIANPILFKLRSLKDAKKVIFTFYNANEKSQVFKKQTYDIEEIVEPDTDKFTIFKVSVLDGDIKLNIESRQVCLQNFHSLDCQVYCKAVDNDSGHYNCDRDGKKVCISGWEDVSKNCTVQSNYITPAPLEPIKYSTLAPIGDNWNMRIKLRLIELNWSEDLEISSGTNCETTCQLSMALGFVKTKNVAIGERKLGPFKSNSYTINFGDVIASPSGDVENPVEFYYNNDYGKIDLFVQIYNGTDIAPFTIKYYEWNEVVEFNSVPLSGNTKDLFIDVQRGKLKLHIKGSYACKENFYGTYCSVYCLGRDNESGHYSCDENGSKICLHEWTDPTNNCTVPIKVTPLPTVAPIGDDWQVKFELKLLTFDWSKNLLLDNGYNCPNAKCIPAINIALLNLLGTDILSQYDIGPFTDGNNIIFKEEIISRDTKVNNPLIFKLKSFESATQAMFTFYHDKDISKQLYQGKVPIAQLIRLQSSQDFQDTEINAQNGKLRLKVQGRITCRKDYYGRRCLVYCAATDDDTGHYNCDGNGSKVCLEGWKDVAQNCTVPSTDKTTMPPVAPEFSTIKPYDDNWQMKIKLKLNELKWTEDLQLITGMQCNGNCHITMGIGLAEWTPGKSTIMQQIKIGPFMSDTKFSDLIVSGNAFVQNPIQLNYSVTLTNKPHVFFEFYNGTNRQQYIVGYFSPLDTVVNFNGVEKYGSYKDYELSVRGGKLKLTLQGSAYCRDNYYGDQCKKFCRAEDDDSIGHYTCDENGDIICRPGWKDTSSQCKVPIVTDTPVSTLPTLSPNKVDWRASFELRFVRFRWTNSLHLENNQNCPGKSLDDSGCTPSINTAVLTQDESAILSEFNIGPFGLPADVRFTDLIRSGDKYLENPLKFKMDEKTTSHSVLLTFFNGRDRSQQIAQSKLLLADLVNNSNSQTYNFKDVTIKAQDSNIVLQIQSLLRCRNNYYGLDCAAFCKARDDNLGHYNCDKNGKLICLDGWIDPETNCTTEFKTESPTEPPTVIEFSTLAPVGDDWQVRIELNLQKLSWSEQLQVNSQENCRNSCQISIRIGFMSAKMKIIQQITIGPLASSTNTVEFGKIITVGDENTENPLLFSIPSKHLDSSVFFEIYNGTSRSEHIDGVLVSLGQAINFQPRQNDAAGKSYEVSIFKGKLKLKLTGKAYCREAYYGNQCSNHCKEQDDDTNGHYTCDANGDKICRAGWENPNNDCKNAIATPLPITTLPTIAPKGDDWRVIFQVILNSVTYGKVTLEDGRPCPNSSCAPSFNLAMLNANETAIDTQFDIGPFPLKSNLFHILIPSGNSEIKNPIEFKVRQKLLNRTLLVTCYDRTERQNQIGQLKVPFENFIQPYPVYGRHIFKNYKIAFQNGQIIFCIEGRALCRSDYYNKDCSLYCKAQDNDAGHYDCDRNGEKICLDGWKDPSTNCTVPASSQEPGPQPVPPTFPPYDTKNVTWRVKFELYLVKMKWSKDLILANNAVCSNGDLNTCSPSVSISLLTAKPRKLIEDYVLGPFLRQNGEYVFEKSIPAGDVYEDNPIAFTHILNEAENFVNFEFYNGTNREDFISSKIENMKDITKFNPLPKPGTYKDWDLSILDNKLKLTLKGRAYCRENHYGTKCEVHCEEHDDDQNGHYVCDENGEKICRPGWKNTDNSCKDAEVTSSPITTLPTLSPIDDDWRVLLQVKLVSFNYGDIQLQNQRPCPNSKCSPSINLAMLNSAETAIDAQYDIGPFDAESNTFSNEIVSGDSSIENPIEFKVAQKHPNQILLVTLYNEYNRQEHIGRTKVPFGKFIQSDPESSDTAFKDYKITLQDEKVVFLIQGRAICRSDYYGKDCSLYCKAQDNDKGHYDCDRNGKKICLDGWKNPEANCKTPAATKAPGPAPPTIPTADFKNETWRVWFELYLVKLEWSNKLILSTGAKCGQGNLNICSPTISVSLISIDPVKILDNFKLGPFSNAGGKYIFGKSIPTENEPEKNPIIFTHVLNEMENSVYFEFYNGTNRANFIKSTVEELADMVIFNPLPKPGAFKDWSLSLLGNKLKLQLKGRAFCKDHYYGKKCEVFCLPRNNTQGHYFCDDNGERLCHEGWIDPVTYCVTRKGEPNLELPDWDKLCPNPEMACFAVNGTISTTKRHQINSYIFDYINEAGLGFQELQVKFTVVVTKDKSNDTICSVELKNAYAPPKVRIYQLLFKNGYLQKNVLSPLGLVLDKEVVTRTTGNSGVRLVSNILLSSILSLSLLFFNI